MNKKILTALLLTFLASTAIAEQIRYVSDKLIITIRSGPSIQNKIVRKIESGARVEVFDTSEDGQYTQIRTQNGVEGWVLSQYLIDEPVAEQKLEGAEKNLIREQEKSSRLAAQVNQLNQQIKELKSENAMLTKNSSEMKNEITSISKAASRPIELDRENKELRESLGKITTELQIVNNQYQKIKDNEQQEWFIIGAGVLLAGILLGFLIPKLRFTRKDSWGSL
ncbi:MAG: TIGR04211 family SH3 domain-containing protein [Gammaproteobacteria bacterium]|nr:TIGR04211 family SH3 domain-containing protein [Gammaproteobacteria bacterium]MDH5594116.1 TIGR04211 family SH3 domain-containing protein [Gammaproteobacteria bacterium]MDH5613971.1 TIGR04211 family SH3 domain-containing protein [Gammaproteobacteria bacterium]